MTTQTETNQIREKRTKNDYLNETCSNYKNINVKKYILDLGDGEKAEILYPTLPNFNNQYDTNLNSIKNIFIMVDPTKLKDGPNESLCKSLLGIYTDVIFDIESQEFKIIIQGFVPNGPCYRHKRLKMGKKKNYYLN
jgi:hypothetical protein